MVIRDFIVLMLKNPVTDSVDGLVSVCVYILLFFFFFVIVCIKRAANHML